MTDVATAPQTVAPVVPTPEQLLEQHNQIVDNIRRRRSALLTELDGLDDAAKSMGIEFDSTGARKQGKGKANGKPDGRRTRKNFGKSARDSIFDIIRAYKKQHGGRKAPSTHEINEAWQKEGRAGNANVTLNTMLKAKELKRVKDDSVRGSRYDIMTAAKGTTKTKGSEPAKTDASETNGGTHATEQE